MYFKSCNKRDEHSVFSLFLVADLNQNVYEFQFTFYEMFDGVYLVDMYGKEFGKRQIKMKHFGEKDKLKIGKSSTS